METDEDNGSYLAKELKAGVSVSDTIDNFTKPVFFSFKLDDAEHVKTIQIHLTPIRGRFVFALRNDEKKPDMDQTFWKSDSNELLITNDDQLFKPNVMYTIGVFAQPSTKDVNSHQDYHFHIRWSYTGKHNVLVPGIPLHTTLAHTSQCFTFEINSNWQQIMVAKHAASNNLDLYSSIGNSHDIPTLQKYDHKAESDESGFEVSKIQLNTLCKAEFSKGRHCNAYLCVYGAVKEKFMISFTYNNGPFLLLEGQSFFGPLPVGNEAIHFVYHPHKESPCDVEEFAANWAVGLAATLMENPTSIPFPALTERVSHSLTNLHHFKRDDIAILKKPVIAISVGRRANTPAVPNQDFNFKGHFGLEAGYMLKELIRGTPRLGFAEKGEWKYFYFYNSKATLSLYVGMDSINQGDGDLYITRGKDRRPTISSNLAKSSSIKSAFITLPVETVQGRGYEDLRGFYTVGIHANTNLRFSLVWKHTRSDVMYAAIGIPFSVVIKPSHPLRVVLYNNFNEDIEVQLNTHHHSAMLYWTTDSSVSTYRENDMELFPNANNHKIKQLISKESAAHTFVIPKNTVGFCYRCKWFITVNCLDNNDLIDLDFKFMVAGSARGQFPEEIHAGKFYEFEAAKNDVRIYRLFVTAEQFKNFKAFYLETHFIIGTAEITIGDKGIMGAPTPDAFKATVIAGYNNVTFEHIKLQHPQGPAEDIYVSIRCLSYCRARFAAVEPGKLMVLPVNTPREAISKWSAGNETFVYEATGREKQFEVTFQVEYLIDHKEVELVKGELYKMIRVFFAENLKSLQNGKRTTLKTKYRHADEINHRVILDYKPRKGVFLIEVVSIPQTAYAYTLQVQTQGISILYPGRYTVGRVGRNATDHTYEVTTQRSGAVFMRLSQCFGSVNLASKKRADDYGYRQISVDGNRYTKVWEAEKPGETDFLKLQKEPSSRNKLEFGYLDHTKNVSIYAMEVFEKQAWDTIPFDSIRPLNEDLYIDLKGTSPTIRFRPVQFPRDNLVHQIIYHIVVSKDPEVLNFYLNCGGAYLRHVMKKGYMKKEVIQVFSLGVDPQAEKEFGTNLPYLQGKMNLESGKRYFASVIAFVKLKKQQNTEKFLTSNSLRVMYRTTEFEYRSFFYPMELLASTLGLLAILVSSFFLLNANVGKHIRKLLGKKSNSNEIDSDLEEYYMQIKNDFDYEEKVRVPSSSQSPNDTRNSNMPLDTSIVSRDPAEERTKRAPVPPESPRINPSRPEEKTEEEEEEESSGADKSVEMTDIPKIKPENDTSVDLV